MGGPGADSVVPPSGPFSSRTRKVAATRSLSMFIHGFPPSLVLVLVLVLSNAHFSKGGVRFGFPFPFPFPFLSFPSLLLHRSCPVRSRTTSPSITKKVTQRREQIREESKHAIKKKTTTKRPGIIILSGARPATSHIDPLRQARAVLALDVDDIGVAAAAAADAVLLGLVVVRPEVVLLAPLLLALGRRVQERDACALPRRSVRRAVLDRGVPVPEIAEVVDVAHGKESACGEGMDRGVSPLGYWSACVMGSFGVRGG